MEQNVNYTSGINNQDAIKTSTKNDDNSAENTLAKIADIVLIVGILASLICLFSLAIVEDRWGDMSFNFSGFAITISVLFSSLISWSLMKVIVNISLTLKDIKNNKR